MPKHKPLFDSDAQSADTPSSALTISAQNLGPEHQLFNQLLEKIEKQTSDLQNLKTLADTYVAQRNAKLSPLEAQSRQLQESLVLFLDQRLQTPKGLSQRMCDQMEEIVGYLLDDLILSCEPSAALQAVADRYYVLDAGSQADDDDFEDGLDKQTSSDRNRAMAEAMGVEVNPDEMLSTDDMIAALLRKLQSDDEAAMQAHAQRQSKRKKSAKQKQAEQDDLDAHSALRTIYRKLVSALHPDRESDPAERVRKTQLMVRVNAANDSKDLRALLHLQLEIAQIDPASVAAMADGQLRSFNRMLKDQLKTLQDEYKFMLESVRNGFGLHYGGVNVKVLDTRLRVDAVQAQRLIDQLQEDLKTVQNDVGLKYWVKLQMAEMNRMMQQDYY
jgi:uncharacterized phage infection (PIP) family protein YhgE